MMNAINNGEGNVQSEAMEIAQRIDALVDSGILKMYFNGPKAQHYKTENGHYTFFVEWTDSTKSKIESLGMITPSFDRCRFIASAPSSYATIASYHSVIEHLESELEVGSAPKKIKDLAEIKALFAEAAELFAEQIEEANKAAIVARENYGEFRVVDVFIRSDGEIGGAFIQSWYTDRNGEIQGWIRAVGRYPCPNGKNGRCTHSGFPIAECFWGWHMGESPVSRDLNIFALILDGEL